jgi:hypothetical protein
MQLAFEAALDSAYTVERARRAALGDTVTHPAVLGAAMRDLELARHAPVWDEAVVGRLAEAFAALPAPSAEDDLVQRARKLARFPAVAAADSDAVIATHAGSPFRVRDLLGEWRLLRALDRPHLADERQVRDFIGTALYQRLLRAQARPAGAPARPADARVLRDQAEGFAATAWAVRHVFSQVPRDSLTLRREYDRDPSRWDLPARAEIVRRHLSTREDAERLAARLRTRAGADSLAAHDRAQPERVPDLVDERGDRALTERSLAAGDFGVVGPTRWPLRSGAWRWYWRRRRGVHEHWTKRAAPSIARGSTPRVNAACARRSTGCGGSTANGSTRRRWRWLQAAAGGAIDVRLGDDVCLRVHGGRCGAVERGKCFDSSHISGHLGAEQLRRLEMIRRLLMIMALLIVAIPAVANEPPDIASAGSARGSALDASLAAQPDGAPPFDLLSVRRPGPGHATVPSHSAIG